MDVNPADHLPLMNRVIQSLGFKGDDFDEAWSQGLVALTEAAVEYDPNRGTPVAAWLAQNVRWSLLTWRSKNWAATHLPLDETGIYVNLRQDIESKVNLNDLVRVINSSLTEDQRAIVYGLALGYEGKEIAQRLKLSEMRVSRERRKALAILRKALEE